MRIRDVIANILAFVVLGGMGALLVFGMSHPDPQVKDAATTAALMMP